VSAAPASISVIIRARDEGASIGRVLDILRRQETGAVTVELVLVDSGSSDDTVAIARAHGVDVVVEIPAESFTFGGALNTGAERASGELLVALSAHAFPLDEGWLARLAAPFDDPRVACACGDAWGPDGAVLEHAVVQDEALARAAPYWGYSNAAGGFRAARWRELPFRADLPGTEDKAWAWHWLQRGMVCVVDPALGVDHSHSKDPLPDIYRRARREWEGLAMDRDDIRPQGVAELARAWWTDRGTYTSPWRARLSHRRAARLAGGFTGRRRGAARRTGDR
jgi:rhamnosyltransferase